MRNALTLSFVVVLCLTALAQEPKKSHNRTDSWILNQTATEALHYDWDNGRSWKTFDAQMKIMTVSGIEQGMMLLAREAYSAEASSANGARLKKLLDDLTIHGFRMSDVADQIDGFYNDSSNIRVPIGDAYMFSLKKMHGANSKELDSFAAYLRQTYNK